VHAVKFRNEDGVILESGMSNQGTGIDVLHVFIFRNSGARELTPREGIATHVNNCGAVDDGKECYSIEGAWRADPGGRVVVHYTGHDENKRHVDQQIVYELRNNKLELVFGQVPSKIIDFR
ncbi:MAG: hypothetical protein ABW003_04555, partial [Microvirga sp.]